MARSLGRVAQPHPEAVVKTLRSNLEEGINLHEDSGVTLLEFGSDIDFFWGGRFGKLESVLHCRGLRGT